MVKSWYESEPQESILLMFKQGEVQEVNCNSLGLFPILMGRERLKQLAMVSIKIGLENEFGCGMGRLVELLEPVQNIFLCLQIKLWKSLKILPLKQEPVWEFQHQQPITGCSQVAQLKIKLCW